MVNRKIEKQNQINLNHEMSKKYNGAVARTNNCLENKFIKDEFSHETRFWAFKS